VQAILTIDANKLKVRQEEGHPNGRRSRKDFPFFFLCVSLFDWDFSWCLGVLVVRNAG
jgi:hypothetical protein